MKGFPKHLNSKYDYCYIKENFPTKKWKPKWQQLLDERYRWIATGTLESESDGIVDDTHRVSSYTTTDTETGEEKIVYEQQEYMENPAADFWRMHFTEEEVLKALAE